MSTRAGSTEETGLRAFPWAHRTMLAPMEGVTHPEFRALTAERGGVGVVCTEFVRISRAPLCARAIAREVVPTPAAALSVQVMGNEPEKMADAAAVVSRAGADVVDINLGCPMPRVVRKGVGAAMLKDPVLLHEVLSAMRERTPVLLSAKIRAGFDDADDAVDIAGVVERAGADFVVIHPRRRCDFYDGVADWRIIRHVKQHLSIPVVGNGDVWYAADALRMRAETGCDAVMIGRPALRNPWMFEQIRDLSEGREPRHPSGADLFDHLSRVCERYMLKYRNPVGRLKEMIRYLGRALSDDRGYRRAVLRLNDLTSIMSLSKASLMPLAAEQIDLHARGLLRLERSGSAVGPRTRAA